MYLQILEFMLYLKINFQTYFMIFVYFLEGECSFTPNVLDPIIYRHVQPNLDSHSV